MWKPQCVHMNRKWLVKWPKYIIRIHIFQSVFLLHSAFLLLLRFFLFFCCCFTWATHYYYYMYYKVSMSMILLPVGLSTLLMLRLSVSCSMFVEIKHRSTPFCFSFRPPQNDDDKIVIIIRLKEHWMWRFSIQNTRPLLVSFFCSHSIRTRILFSSLLS